MLLHAAPPEGVPGLAFLRKPGRDVACWAGAEPLPLSVMHLYTAFFFSLTHIFIHLVRFLGGFVSHGSLIPVFVFSPFCWRLVLTFCGGKENELLSP